MTAVDAHRLPPGSWQRFADHFPHPLTPEYARLFTSTFEPGQAAIFERYGVPFGGLRTHLLDGYVYVAPVPLVGRMGAPVPPRPVLWTVTRLLPEFRRRRRRAERVLRERPWLDEVHEWRQELRPLWVRANFALQEVALGDLDDNALAVHLRRCRANAEEGYRLHFRLHGPDLMATGLLLARGADWGLEPHELLGALTGSSPASTGSDPDLAFVRARLTAVEEAPGSIDELRSVGADVAAAVDRYLHHHGARMITGYDLDGRCLSELPGLLLALVTGTLDAAGRDASPADALRARVPARDRAEFDRLLGDARFTFGLRDENGGLTGAWPVGLLRMAMLEAGRRLADGRRILDPEHAVEVTVDELVELLAGQGPSAEDVATRAMARAEAARRPPDEVLGTPMPDASVARAFPPALSLMVRAMLALAEGSFHRGATPLTGLGIGDRQVQGRACVADDATTAIGKLRPGDILVTAATSPSFNVCLAIAGGLVVEEGGYLSHAAIMARELDLPTVIGAPGARRDIPDGAMVEVDPGRGVVRVVDLARAPL